MKKKILIVDDEYALRELIEMVLDTEYEVIKAENGEQALLIAKSKPDLIILDIMMPGMDGYEVCRRLKSDPETKDIPILMLTAKHGIEDVKEAIRAEVDEYITKPFEPELLRKRIDNFFAEQNNPQERKLFKYGNTIHFIKERKEEE